MTCLITVGLICLTSSATVDLVKTGNFSVASIKDSDIVFMVNIASDYELFGNLNLMPKICMQDVCVVYYRYCWKTKKKFECDYFISLPDVTKPLFTFSASARSEKLLNLRLKSYYIVSGDRRTVSISLLKEKGIKSLPPLKN